MKGTRISKRFAAAFACAVALACAVTAPAAPAALVQSDETLTVGVPVDRCPVFYCDAGTGEVTGIGVDLMRAAAEEAGLDVAFKAVDEPTLKDALDSDAYDLVMPFGSAIKSASGQASVVSENLMQTPFTLVTVGDRSLPQLDDLRVGMLRSLGGGAETVKQLYPGIEIVSYETMDDSVNALRAGQVDALLHNSYVWSYVLQKPAYSDLAVQPSTMFTMDFRAGTLDTPAGRALIERLDEGIAKLPDTRRQAVVLDYTSRKLYRNDISDYLYQFGPIALVVALILVLLIAFVVQRMRTQRLKQEEEMHWLLDHDPQTGVLNLNGFRKRVEELLRAHPDIPYLLSYNNIKNFKYINDSMGMVAGDKLLRFWVEKTLPVLSGFEAVGRIEADHFAILRRSGGEEQMAQDVIDVLEPVQNFFIDQGKDMQVQLCSGIYVLTPEDYQDIDVDHMLDFARVAERRLRESGKEGYEFYNPDQWERGQRAADICGHLLLAIQSGEIEVQYQPQVDYATGEIVGAEALCRWNHAKLGWLLPTEFVPALEETGLIFELDYYVWERVCQDLRRWNAQGVRRSVAVNLSRCDIAQGKDIPSHFSDLVKAYGLTPDQLRVEFTESAYVRDTALLVKTTAELRERGFQVEMDDFGSGFSSLNMLKEVQVDRIKLDLDFLGGAGDPEKGRVIISNVIAMVRSLGMGLIAEGVETEEQAEFLRSQGCAEMQGFFFHKPLPVEDFERISAAPEAATDADEVN